MKQLKRIILITIIGLLSIIGFSTTVDAYSVGQKINVSYREYINNSNIYCVEHHQSLKAQNSYTIISQVRIEGNKSTDYQGNTQTSWHNAKLAYILNADNGSSKNGPVANSIWNYMYTWLTNVGKNHAGLYASFSNGVQGTYGWLDTESTNYANNYNENSQQIKDNTNKDNIKVAVYDKDGTRYVRVGPFNWTFAGKLTGIKAQDENGNEISDLQYSYFNGNNETFTDVGSIESGKDFYISIREDSNVKKITKITGYAQSTRKRC